MTTRLNAAQRMVAAAFAATALAAFLAVGPVQAQSFLVAPSPISPIIAPQAAEPILPPSEPLKAPAAIAEEANQPLQRAALAAPATAARPNPAIIRLQVLLDRVHASPGVIDGVMGSNVAKALAAFQQMNGLAPDGIPAQSVLDLLERAATMPTPAIAPYTLKLEDVAGPFVPAIPKDYAEQAVLDRLGYRDPLELLAEKFHMDEDLLERLNPGLRTTAPADLLGQSILVASPGVRAKAKVARIVADKVLKVLHGFDELGNLVVAYPATIGSSALPSPSGAHLVTAVAVNPEYWYRPQVNFKQGNNDKALRLPPGPNNPVGTVWIGLDKPTYGIHGTPEPSRIDKTNSHGCIRLTNWDAEELVRLVAQGVAVSFTDGPETTASIR